ncbi:MAG: chemotaxis-specific protein-glutamate methyltransferase CheB [Deltaproteobacteria bacterium]|nr:chemotaxis-specific protein-glutamate methyltransferase CheB [Deltaproteobacteria bacterium]
MSPGEPVKVLVVEDSPVVRDLISYILSNAAGLRVIATAATGEAAIETAARLKPDLITMDVNLPGIDGYEATRRIMETSPVPIIIVSASYDPKDLTKMFRMVEAGALTFLPTPLGIGHPGFQARAGELIRTVKLMSEIRVVRRWPKRAATLPRVQVKRTPKTLEVVALGASTGGPLVLKKILAGLRPGFPAPVLIVQHMSPGFVTGLADWLRESTRFPVKVAQPRELILPGNAYVAPDGLHMGIDRSGQIDLYAGEPVSGLRPAVAPLFRSVAERYGPHAAAILLTGMGDDGAAEMAVIKKQGVITIAQDKESSVVHGMPGEAIKLGAADYILPPEKIAELLNTLAETRSRTIQ